MGEKWHGLPFPYRDTAQGLFTEPEDDVLIESSIRFILATNPGEYICFPEFGCRLQERLFEQNDFVLRSLIENDIREALTRWEPRIELLTVNVRSDDSEVRIFLEYVNKTSPDRLRFFEDTFERGA